MNFKFLISDFKSQSPADFDNGSFENFESFLNEWIVLEFARIKLGRFRR